MRLKVYIECAERTWDGILSALRAVVALGANHLFSGSSNAIETRLAAGAISKALSSCSREFSQWTFCWHLGTLATVKSSRTQIVGVVGSRCVRKAEVASIAYVVGIVKSVLAEVAGRAG